MMNEPAVRRSSDPAQAVASSAVHCAIHRLYFTMSEGCWRCRQEAGIPLPEAPPRAALQPELPRQEQPQARQNIPDRVVLVWDRFLQKAKHDAPAAPEILKVCLDLAAFLMEKNAAYGNSALEPVRVLSKADAAEQIRVRIDDKLSRLFRGNAGGEDALKDLVGYWVLLRVAEKRAKENGHE